MVSLNDEPEFDLEDEGLFFRAGRRFQGTADWVATLVAVQYGAVLLFLCSVIFFYLAKRVLVKAYRRHTTARMSDYLIRRYQGTLRSHLPSPRHKD